MKGESSNQIVPAIRWVHEGKIYATPEVFSRLAERITRKLPSGFDHPAEVLSDRELEVFRRIGEGHTTRRIAEELQVSKKAI
jgi:DNA-binding NarL/FixJ family response regulator